jgi:hypothetical protein
VGRFRVGGEGVLLFHVDLPYGPWPFSAMHLFMLDYHGLPLSTFYPGGASGGAPTDKVDVPGSVRFTHEVIRPQDLQSSIPQHQLGE